MHQAQWSPERPLPPPVSLASQSHHEKPPEVTCTSRGNPGFPALTRERPRETVFNTSRGQNGESPGKNTGVGCHVLLQGIIPTQGSNQVSHIAGGFFTI